MTTPSITEEEKKFVLKKLYDLFSIELDRMMLSSAQDKINLLIWIIEEYQNRKWPVIHTGQVMDRDVKTILGNALYRDFILGLSYRLVSECKTLPEGFWSRLIDWRLDTVSVYTLDKPETYTLLNMEVYETLQADKQTLRLIFTDNPWLVVYHILLEYLYEWGEYTSFMKSITTSKQAPQEE